MLEAPTVLPFPLLLYRTLTRTMALPLRRMLRKRATRGKEETARLGEREGVASLPRPDGQLLWCHAASVGESLSVLPLLRQFLEQHPNWHALVTSGTVTSATLLAQRLPPRAVHQYLPLDYPAWAERFHHHWQPSMVWWLESELWPNHLLFLQQKKIPAFLLNARMAERSVQRWQRWPRSVRRMLASFTAILTQDEQETATFTTLSGTPDRITTTGNLKWDSPPLPVDETALDSLWHSIGKRPCWLAASTHPGEEEQLLAVHRQLQQRWPDILLVLVPRHPHRGAAVQALAGSGAQCRTAQSDLLSGTSVYIADTMGEMGLWYRLCPLAFIGGSLVSHGGQNMLEAAQLGCIPLWGRHVHNFRPLAALLQEKGAGFQTDDHDALLQQLTVLLEDLSGCTSLQSHCREEAGKLGGASARTLAIINSFMHN